MTAEECLFFAESKGNIDLHVVDQAKAPTT
jgi:hypothetical protein